MNKDPESVVSGLIWDPPGPPPTTPPPVVHTLHFACIDRLHIVVDGRTLCGWGTPLESDVYADDIGLRVWNAGLLRRCAMCEATLLAKARPLRGAA